MSLTNESNELNCHNQLESVQSTSVSNTKRKRRKAKAKKVKVFSFDESDRLVWVIAQYMNDPSRRPMLKVKEFWNVTLPGEMQHYGLSARPNDDSRGLMSKNPYYKRWKYLETQYVHACVEAGFEGDVDLLKASESVLKKLRLSVDHFDILKSYKTNPDCLDVLSSSNSSISKDDDDEEDAAEDDDEDAGQRHRQRLSSADRQQQNYDQSNRLHSLSDHPMPYPIMSSSSSSFGLAARLESLEASTKISLRSIDESLQDMRSTIKDLSGKIDLMRSSDLLHHLLLVRLTRLTETGGKDDAPQLLQMIGILEQQAFGPMNFGFSNSSTGLESPANLDSMMYHEHGK